MGSGRGDLPAEEEEVGRGTEDGEDTHDILIDIGTCSPPRHHQQHEAVGHHEESLGWGGDLQENTQLAIMKRTHSWPP